MDVRNAMVFDPLRGFPGYALRRASNAALAELTPKLSELHLRLTEATVLIAILHNPNITQSEVGRMLGIASANIAPLIGRLDERGLIQRNPFDGRSHGLDLTEAGRELATDEFDIVQTHEDGLLRRLPLEQRLIFIDTLNAFWSSETE